MSNKRPEDFQAHRITVDSDLKQHRALRLRAERGMSYRAIGEAIGVSHAMAHKYVVDALAQIRAQTLEDAQEVRELELQRLDLLWSRGNHAMLKAMARGELSAVASLVNAMLRVSERRSVMMGLDAQRYLPPSGAAAPSAIDPNRLSMEQLVEFYALLSTAAGEPMPETPALPGEVFGDATITPSPAPNDPPTPTAG